jgi:putative transposase
MGLIWKGRQGMAGKRHSAEQIINKLREAEVLLAEGHSVPEVGRRLGVTVQTYYRWRKEYGGLKTDQARKLKDLEKENARLKRLVADLALDKAMLQEVASGNF